MPDKDKDKYNKDLKNKPQNKNSEMIYDLIPPKMDFVFKHIFGNEKHKKTLVSFLSAVLRMPKEELEGLEILNSELIKNHKKGVLDVRVRTKDNKEIDIEVQILDSGYMAERTLFYWSKMYNGQIESGGKYTDLKKCITINIVDFDVTPLKKLNSTFHIFEDETNFKLTDVLEIHFLELKKLYDKEVPRDENDPLVMWMEFIDGNKEVIDVLSKKNEDINYAYDLLKIISKDKEARMAYETQMAALRDEMTRLHVAEERGLYKGREEGRMEGKIEGKKEVAERMLRKGMEVETVAEITGLQPSDVEEIRKNMAKKNENKKQPDSFFEIIKEGKKARMEYEAQMVALRDEMTRLHVVEERGLNKGREEGRMEAKINVARNLISLSADTEMIIKATGLTDEEIKHIKEEMRNIKN